MSASWLFFEFSASQLAVFRVFSQAVGCFSSFQPGSWHFRPFNHNMDGLEYQYLVNFLRENEYPDGFLKNDKRVLRRKAKTFSFEDGKLYYVGEEKKNGKRLVLKGDEEKLRVLWECHEGAVGAGHFGLNRTREKVAERFWWNTVAEDVKEYCKTCDKCQIANPLNKAGPAELHPIPVSNELFSRWGVDLVGPLRETKNGNRYIIVGTEYLTRWPEAAAIKEKTAAEVGDFILHQIIFRYFAPKYLLSDQG